MENRVLLVGMITENFTYSHESCGEKFFEGIVSTKRSSGTEDKIPVVISEYMIDTERDYMGDVVQIIGQYRSYNKHTPDGTRLILSVFVQEFAKSYEKEDRNEITLVGFLCKDPTYRRTPLGREIADVLLAVNRPYGKSDYLPCIFWGRNARKISELGVGSCVRIYGRIQSREYVKNFETKTAYEVSVTSFALVDS